jgi:nucleotide-binding universal stress UspA family protein
MPAARQSFMIATVVTTGDNPMKVLIAVADMTYGRAIADFVGSHNWNPGTLFRVIHAVQVNELTYLADNEFCCALSKDMIEERDRRARSLVKGVAAQIQSKLPGAAIEDDLIFGKAKDVILDQAEEWNADMIVVGSHGLKGFSRFLLGSVSLSVLSHAPCSVMIVKLPKQDEAVPLAEKAEVAQKDKKSQARKQKVASATK